MAKGMSDEERVAKRITDLLADQRLNLDRIGMYVARIEPSSNYRRVMIVAESADEEWEQVNGRHNRL
jgi:acetolactate synthase small subunit